MSICKGSPDLNLKNSVSLVLNVTPTLPPILRKGKDFVKEGLPSNYLLLKKRIFG